VWRRDRRWRGMRMRWRLRRCWMSAIVRFLSRRRIVYLFMRNWMKIHLIWVMWLKNSDCFIIIFYIDI
jgi:hypothetical protein